MPPVAEFPHLPSHFFFARGADAVGAFFGVHPEQSCNEGLSGCLGTQLDGTLPNATVD